jgi:hypothetical protein
MTKEEILFKHGVAEVCINSKTLFPAMDEYAKQEAMEFSKWLQHLDNGTTHYNPFTKEETESIGFSPHDCLTDEIYTIEQLY